MVKLAETGNLRAYVDWSGQDVPFEYSDPEASERFGPNMWDWYFEQPHGLTGSEPMVDTWVFDKISSPHYFTFDVCTPEDLTFKRSIIPRLLRPLESGRRLAEGLFDEYNVDPSKTISVQYRGNDSLHDPYRPASHQKSLMDHEDMITGLLVKYPDHKIWIQSDDLGVIEKFRERFPGSLTIKYFLSIPHNAGKYSDQLSTKSGYHRGLDAVAMMIMFSMCSVMVKSISNLAEIAASLSTGEIIHIP